MESPDESATRPLTIRVRRLGEESDATALGESIYYAACSFIDEMANSPGDEQVTTDYIMGVVDDLFAEESGSGETVLTFLFRDAGMCPLGARACRHWFELAFTQLDLEEHAKGAGFALAERVPGLAQVLVTPSPFTYINEVLVACEKNADGSFDLIADDGCEVPDWKDLSQAERDTMAI